MQAWAARGFPGSFFGVVVAALRQVLPEGHSPNRDRQHGSRLQGALVEMPVIDSGF